MRVKGIMGQNKNVNPVEVKLHFEEARGLTFWNKNDVRLVLTKDQEDIVKSVVNVVEVYNGYNSKFVSLEEIAQ